MRNFTPVFVTGWRFFAGEGDLDLEAALDFDAVVAPTERDLDGERVEEEEEDLPADVCVVERVDARGMMVTRFDGARLNDISSAVGRIRMVAWKGNGEAELERASNGRRVTGGVLMRVRVV